MLDEGNMEKKPISRHSPVPVKTSTGDKKTGEVPIVVNDNFILVSSL